MKGLKDTEEISYTEFYLAGDCIFKCKTSWLNSVEMMEEKKKELAEENDVNVDLITTAEITINLPLPLPNIDSFLNGTGVKFQ